MFKYVENMRKEALIIMSKTYGAKHKTTGQPFYDSYPLENLVKLLCYEDEEEARTACQHYGITVEDDQVLWRHGRFAEPRDPEKGHIIPLKPRKMVRTIESKLNFATRLSVCRGGVSGEGATLSIKSPGDSVTQLNRKSTQESSEISRNDAIKLQLEADAKARAEKKKLEIERLKQEKLAAEIRSKAEAAKRAETERLEQESLRRERILVEERRKEVEALRLAEAKAAAERAARERLEREAQEREVARKKAEDEEKTRERQRLLAELREQEARRSAEIQAAKERAEKERRELVERHRLADLRKKAEEERIRKDQEEKKRRIEMMWLEKIEKARKILVWRLWRKQVQKQECLQQSHRCLASLDPTSTHYPASLTSRPSMIITCHDKINSPSDFDLEGEIYRLATASREPINLARMLAESMPKSSITDSDFQHTLLPSSNVILFKLAVLLPKRTHGNENMHDTLRMWVNSHLRPGTISTHTFTIRSKKIESRAVSVENDHSAGFTDCNAVLILLPSDAKLPSQVEFPEEVEELLANNVPRIVLVLEDEKSAGKISSTESILDNLVGASQDREGVVVPKLSHFDHAFEQCCEALVEAHANSLSDDCPSLVRVSLANIGFLCLRRLFENMEAAGFFRSASSKDTVFIFVKQALTSLMTELSNASNEIHQTKQNWPPIELYDHDTESIPSFFNGQYDLPFDWHIPLSDLNSKLFDSFQELLVKESFVEAVERFILLLPSNIGQWLQTMIDNDDLSRSFFAVVSIIVNGELIAETRDETILYLPTETIATIIENAATYEAPYISDPVLIDIPGYLYTNTSAMDEEVNNTGRELIAQSSEMYENKRKPSVVSDVEVETLRTERIKRIRSQEPSLPNETPEQRESREFTSYLEALLVSGES